MTRADAIRTLALTFVLALAAAAAGASEAPPLALTGLDPVALVAGQELPGDPQLTVEEGDYTYRFASAGNRSRFTAEPGRYRIQNEMCPVSPSSPARPEHFAVHDGKIYIFATAHCIEEFQADPGGFVGDEDPLSVAILLYDGVELLDFAGPGEVFAAARRGRAFDVYTVAASSDPILSQGFVEVKPELTFANAPQPDVLVIPGGGVGPLLEDAATLQWLGTAAAEAKVVLSVCSGAFVLARLGLLDGREATTHHNALGALARLAPTATVVEGRRYVDSGQVVTSAGVASGIEAALHVVQRLLGPAPAQQTALYMEYPWPPPAAEAAAGR